jgi:hypothetical protein
MDVSVVVVVRCHHLEKNNKCGFFSTKNFKNVEICRITYK